LAPSYPLLMEEWRVVVRAGCQKYLVISVTLAVLVISGCGSSSGGPESGTLKVTFGSFPDYLDPALSHSEEGWTAIYDTYVPLLTYKHASGKEGSVVIPGLARSLPKISADGQTYELRLRDGLRYSDGTPVRASDFARAVERVFALNSSGSTYLHGHRRRGGIREDEDGWDLWHRHR
jgi:peptide/nickel transport system substrate-binding protein